MAEDGKLKIEPIFNEALLVKGMSKLGNIVNKGSSAMVKAIVPVSEAFSKLSDMSENLQRNLTETEDIFGEFAAKIEGKGATAFSSMGISMSDFLERANEMGEALKGSGFDMVTAADMSAEALQRAADIASTMGISSADAFNAVTEAASGNFATMSDLGVVMDDAAVDAYALSKGLETSYEAMDKQTQIGLAMEMFLEKTAAAAGNCAKENETLSGSLNSAKAAFDTFLSGAGDIEGIADSFSNVAEVITKNIAELAPRMADGIGGIINKLSPQIPGIMEDLLPVIISGVTELLDGLIGALPRLTSVLIDVIPMIIEAIFRMSRELLKAGRQIISAIYDGIKAELPLAGEVLGAIVPIANGLLMTIEKLSGAIAVCAVAFAAFQTVGFVTSVFTGLNALISANTALTALNSSAQGAAAISQSLYALAIKLGVLSYSENAAAAGAAATATVAYAGAAGVGTVAAKAFSAALSANPIGLILVGLAALSGIILLIEKAFEKETEAQKQRRITIEETVKANKDLANSLKESSNEAEKSIKGANAQAAASNKLIDRIEELSKAAADDIFARKELIRTVDLLNKSQDGLNLTYDAETNKLSMTTKELRENVEARRAKLESQAAESLYLKKLEKQMELEQSIEETQIQLAAERVRIRKENAGIDGDMIDRIINENENVITLTGSLKELQDIEKNHAIGLGIAEKAVMKYSESVEETAETVKTSGDIQADIVAKRAELDKKMTDSMIKAANAQGLTLDEYKEKLEKVADAQQDYIDNVVNGLDYLTLDMETSYDDMIDAVIENEKVMKNWSDNLEAIAESGFSGFADILKEQGVEATGHAAHEMAKQLKELESALGESVETMIYKVRAFPSAYDDILSEGQLIALNNLADMESAISGEYSKFEALGYGTAYAQLEAYKAGIIELPAAAVAGMEAALAAIEDQTPDFSNLWEGIKTRQEELAAEREAKEAAREAEQAAKDSFEKESKLIEKRIELNELSAAQSIAAWRNLGEKYKGYTDLKEKADEKAAEIFKKYQTDQYDVYVDAIEKKKREAETSFEWEIRQYELLAKKYADNAELKAKAEEKLGAIQEDVLSRQAELVKGIAEKEREYSDAVKSRTQEILSATKVSVDLTTEEERLQNIADSAQKTRELNQREKELNVTRNDCNAATEERLAAEEELKALTKERIQLQKEEAEVRKSNGQLMIEGLKEQITALKDWAKNRNDLLKRGVDEKALAELSQEEIAAMSKMSASELDEYKSLWKDSQKIAEENSEKELEAQKEELINFITDSEKELTDLLGLLELENCSIGKRTMEGLISGMESEKDNVAKSAVAIAEKMIEAMKKTLRINSPSAEAMDIMGYFGEGFLVQGQKMLPEFQKMSTQMADALNVDLSSTKFGFDTPGLLTAPTSYDERNSGDSYTYNINSMALNERDVIRIIRDYDRRRRWA